MKIICSKNTAILCAILMGGLSNLIAKKPLKSRRHKDGDTSAKKLYRPQNRSQGNNVDLDTSAKNLCKFRSHKGDRDPSSKNLFKSQRYDVDFDTSMDFYKLDYPFASTITPSPFEYPFIIKMDDRLEWKKNHEIMRFCKELYERNNLSRVKPKSKPIIPKIIHVIWVGPKPIPTILQKCFESIQEFMPDWEYKLWTDTEVASLVLENQKFYDEEKNYGAKSDILRYELLYRFGGVYLDVDFVIQQPFDVLHHTYEFYCSLMPANTRDVIANGLIGSVPGHPILKECIESIKDNRPIEDIILRTGPILFERALYKACKNSENYRSIVFPRSFFIPLDCCRLEKLDLNDAITQRIKPECFAIHYWGASWFE